jgi:hypothetical protein
MSEFERQLEQSLQVFILKFKTEKDFSEIKNLYKNNFVFIKSSIEEFGDKGAIEDISKLDSDLSPKISSNMLFLKEINRAIKTGKLLAKDL